jgi:hypothetical protein
LSAFIVAAPNFWPRSKAAIGSALWNLTSESFSRL